MIARTTRVRVLVSNPPIDLLWHLEKNPVLSHMFERLPGMLASYDWWLRRAGLATIAQFVVPWSFTVSST